MNHKTNTIILALLVLITLCVTSCTKSGTCLQGRVLENGTEIPLEDVEVVIMANKSQGLFEPVITWEAGRAKTNNKGRFSIEVEDADFYNISSFNKEGYFPTLLVNLNDPLGLSQKSSLSDNGERKNPDFYLDPEGFLGLKIVNDSGIHGDFLRATIPNHPGPLETSDYFENIYTLRATRTIKYSYRVDNMDLVKDSFYLEKFDTVQINIVF